ncbi:hypothetical protein DPMN_029623 [Dreissena polymorpha]|uniref:Membrane protein BRI3 n=1 Tax=Dreissena polymorpha TaxID=45954 RepID=A0A9D4LZB5_DREPO|nr:hypothetical protein DPMN_029563 [Dreissena polymorpha]KAH3866546.1 hypothetical protein DPMN_029623 [Dreissena polymorpha]
MADNRAYGTMPPGAPGPHQPSPGPYPPIGQYMPVTPNCMACRVGFMQEGYSIVGIILAIVFFPIGILCCLMMKEKKCSNCGSTVSM